MSEDSIEWNEPRIIEEHYEQSHPRKTWKQILDFFHNKKLLTYLVIILSLSLVGTTTIIVVQNQHIQNLENVVSGENTDLITILEEYEILKDVLEEPLENPVIPTATQVRSWLSTDDTDSFDYVEGVWSCGDFAAMLMTRAKEKNWRVRICVIWFSLEGEDGYGSTTSIYGSGPGHVFNMIECTDGEWYIEPQTDGMWYFTNSITEARTEFQIHRYYDFEDSNSDTLWDTYTIWTNFYGYFG